MIFFFNSFFFELCFFSEFWQKTESEKNVVFLKTRSFQSYGKRQSEKITFVFLFSFLTHSFPSYGERHKRHKVRKMTFFFFFLTRFFSELWQKMQSEKMTVFFLFVLNLIFFD